MNQRRRIAASVVLSLGLSGSAIAHDGLVSEAEAVKLADHHIQQRSPTYQCRIAEPQPPTVKAAGVSVPIEVSGPASAEHHELLCMPPLRPGVRGHALIVHVSKRTKDVRIVEVR